MVRPPCCCRPCRKYCASAGRHQMASPPEGPPQLFLPRRAGSFPWASRGHGMTAITAPSVSFEIIQSSYTVKGVSGCTEMISSSSGTLPVLVTCAHSDVWLRNEPPATGRTLVWTVSTVHRSPQLPTHVLPAAKGLKPSRGCPHGGMPSFAPTLSLPVRSGPLGGQKENVLWWPQGHRLQPSACIAQYSSWPAAWNTTQLTTLTVRT